MDERTPTLEQVLARREARQQRQRELLAERHMPLVSLTVVAPGPVKQSELIERIYAEAVAEVEQRIRDIELWPWWDREETLAETGPELLLSVDAFVGDLKRALVDLEDTHPWGRLWDLDVVDERGPITRAMIGAEPRRCLLCERPSPECARSRRHSVAELQQAVADLVTQHPLD